MDLGGPICGRLLATVVLARRHRARKAIELATLDQIAIDAKTENLERAVSLHLMLEKLLKRSDWSDPREILREQVPFGGLLAIASARIERARRDPARVLAVKERLERAEHAAADGLVTAFVEALLELGLSRGGVERAIGEVKRRAGAGGE